MKILDAVMKKGEKKNRILMIPVDELTPNAFQPRSNFDEGDMDSLADSIMRYGIIQPIVIKQRENVPKLSLNGETVCGAKYEIIAGERRWRAAKKLMMNEVPCIFSEADKLQSAEIALIENLQRADLNCFEEAYAIKSLIIISGMTQTEAASRLSLSQPAVANKMKLLKLSPEERSAILENALSERHARAIARVDDKRARIELLEKVISASMSVSECERMVDLYLKGESRQKEKSRARTIGIISDIRFFLNSVNRAVGIVNDAGIKIERKETDMGDYIEMVLKIPKGSR